MGGKVNGEMLDLSLTPKIPSCLLAIFGVKTRDFEEKSLKTGNFACSLYFAEYYQFL
jgi:hypothetical protein